MSPTTRSQTCTTTSTTTPSRPRKLILEVTSRSTPRKLILNVTARSHPRKLILNVTSRSTPRRLTLYTHPTASIRTTLPPPTYAPLFSWVSAQNAQGPLTTLTTHPILHHDLNAEVVRWANEFYSQPLRIPGTSAWFDGKAAVKAWAKGLEAGRVPAEGDAQATTSDIKVESESESELERASERIKRESSLDEDFVC